MIQFIQDNSALDSLQAVIPELGELIGNWDEISDFRKGELIGTTVGKYGLDLFLFAGATKGIKAFHEIRTANAILTLDTMKFLEKRKVLQEISSQWKSKTALELKKIQSGELLPNKELYKKYRSQKLSEHQVRKILHEAESRTLPRPKGIPKDWEVSITNPLVK